MTPAVEIWYWNQVSVTVLELENFFHGTEFIIADGRIREVVDPDQEDVLYV